MLRHTNFQATEYVIVTGSKGNIKRKGYGLGFFYNDATTSIKVIPSTAFDTSYVFNDIITKDFQNISVQGDISYVISDFETASEKTDFSYLNRQGYGSKLNEAQSKMSKRIIGIVKAEIARFMASKDIRSAIQSQNELAKELNEAVKANAYVREFGLSIINISVLGISPQPKTREALEAATREEILKQQDDAIYKRRNFAIEQERNIKENELNTEISIAEKEREKEEKAIDAQMSLQEKNAEAQMKKLSDEHELLMKEVETHMISDKALHEKEMEARKFTQEEQAVANETRRSMADTKAYESEVLMKVFEKIDKDVLTALLLSGMDSGKMIAKAFGDLASNSEKIGNLNISPDLLESLVKR